MTASFFASFFASRPTRRWWRWDGQRIILFGVVVAFISSKLIIGLLLLLLLAFGSSSIQPWTSRPLFAHQDCTRYRRILTHGIVIHIQNNHFSISLGNFGVFCVETIRVIVASFVIILIVVERR